MLQNPSKPVIFMNMSPSLFTHLSSTRQVIHHTTWPSCFACLRDANQVILCSSRHCGDVWLIHCLCHELNIELQFVKGKRKKKNRMKSFEWKQIHVAGSVGQFKVVLWREVLSTSYVSYGNLHTFSLVSFIFVFYFSSSFSSRLCLLLIN